MQLLFPLVLIAAFYFLLLRPQQQRVRSHNALIAAVDVGDEIVTAGGIVGVIKSISERDVQLEIAPSVVVTLAKGAIAQKAPKDSDFTESSESSE
jgi:preprotein translocase subunit YajC